jgi:FkbM family methyltransferase
MKNEEDIFLDRVHEIFGETGPAVILDVGARELGSSQALSRAFPNARVIGFEPNPEQYGHCLSNQNGWPNIEFFPYACGDAEGTVDFYIVEGNCGASSMLEPIHIPGNWPWKKTSVRCVRLDDFLKSIGVEQVDIVWMDVQGLELKTLQGLGSYINNVKIMHTEASGKPYYVGHTDKSELQEWIEQQGFTVSWIPHAGHPYEEGDFTCIRK